ncbi:NADH dehydrogenase [ubiquinone] 1 beta subcomplex subunit 2, mitochondrial [Liparis tanakae]|uniref:NADH dehydrogenase [ubiquinone] 1 beta subcomplex subunit 2, mitochondrial n=1 Tax=Liparis tanakae TaxID=230148 RepID=A0A4Z2HDV3_9TELE|nr:NADH dehydrogenase [ubiquinone] 1 beta subcomplex subunit 2, mitochondrial [Liparis tanakae]
MRIRAGPLQTRNRWRTGILGFLFEINLGEEDGGKSLARRVTVTVTRFQTETIVDGCGGRGGENGPRRVFGEDGGLSVTDHRVFGRALGILRTGGQLLRRSTQKITTRKAGDGPHIEAQYRAYPQITKNQKLQSEILSGAMWVTSPGRTPLHGQMRSSESQRTMKNKIKYLTG